MDIKYKKLYSFKEMQELKFIVSNFIKKNKIEFGFKILKEFIEKYPNNVYAKVEYAKVLNEMGKYNESLYYLKEGYSNINYFTEREKNYIIISLIHCYYNLSQYKCALKLIDKNINSIDDSFTLKAVNNLYTLIKFRLGLISEEEINSSFAPYSCKQQINYNLFNALEHIKLHCIENPNKENHSVFSKNINIEELFFKIKDDLPNAKINYESGLSTVYQYYYSNVGFVEDSIKNYLKVVVAKNTYNILTMYPSDKKYSVVNYLPVSLEENKGESMIDKFNKRYNYKK